MPWQFLGQALRNQQLPLPSLEVLAIGTQPPWCKETNLLPESITGRGICGPYDWAILEADPPALVSLPKWHLVEQRRIVPTKPWPNGSFVSKINDCYFMLLNFKVVYYIEIYNQNISLEYELAVYFTLANEIWKKWWCASSEPIPILKRPWELLFYFSILPLEPVGRWETYAQLLIAPANSHLTSRNVSKTILDQSGTHQWTSVQEQGSPDPPSLAQTRTSYCCSNLGLRYEWNVVERQQITSAGPLYTFTANWC